MSEVPVDLAAFYVIEENDDMGVSARGPYTMAEAEDILQVDQKIITRQQFAAMQATEKSAARPEGTAVQAKMRRDIRSWGLLLLLLGGITIFANDFSNSGWGLMLVVVALASFYFREAPMYVIYGVTISFAAISNLLNASGAWPAFAIVQIFFAFQTFRQYFKFRSVDAESTQNRCQRFFPWVSCILGSLSLVGFVGIFVIAILIALIVENLFFNTVLSFIESLVVDMAILGVATGLASLLSKFPHKLFAIIGTAAGSFVLLFEIALSFLGS